MNFFFKKNEGPRRYAPRTLEQRGRHNQRQASQGLVTSKIEIIHAISKQRRGLHSRRLDLNDQFYGKFLLIA